MAFKRINNSDSLEVRLRATEDLMARIETHFSRFVVDAMGNDQKVSDGTRSYVTQQRLHIERNAFGLASKEVTAGLSADGKVALALVDTLAQAVATKDFPTVISSLADALPAMGVSDAIIEAKVSPAVARAVDAAAVAPAAAVKDGG